MTADNVPSKRPDLDIELTPTGIRNLMGEIQKRGFHPLTEEGENKEIANLQAHEFLNFVQVVLDRIGVRQHEVDKTLALDLGGQDPDWDKILKTIWNKRAKVWGWVETPTNYFATFSTLVEHFETDNNQRKKERIASLGSGPGLYEAYLMYLLSRVGGHQNVEMYCVDFAREMTAINSRILKLYKDESGKMIQNTRALTGDMTNLDFPDNHFNQIICNNALQWTQNWKDAVSEMARVLNPQGLGVLYIFINRHPMRLINQETNEVMLSIGGIDPAELFDALEEKNFQIERTRQYRTAKGLGQMGGTSDRMFIKARLSKDGTVNSWRQANIGYSVSTWESGR